MIDTFVPPASRTVPASAGSDDGSAPTSRISIEYRPGGSSRGSVAVCGSNRLLRLAMELGAPQEASVEVSLEAHMACGLGYCHGCSTGHPGLASESPLVCKDGPVFACIRGGAA